MSSWSLLRHQPLAPFLSLLFHWQSLSSGQILSPPLLSYGWWRPWRHVRDHKHSPIMVRKDAPSLMSISHGVHSSKGNHRVGQIHGVGAPRSRSRKIQLVCLGWNPFCPFQTKATLGTWRTRPSCATGQGPSVDRSSMEENGDIHGQVLFRGGRNTAKQTSEMLGKEWR